MPGKPRPVVALIRATRHESEPDAELVRNFVRTGDQPAFTEIVRRYGPLVRAVCQRTVSGADAEDAFQASFLVLARDAKRITEPAALAGWLQRTAYLTAKRVRETTARHRSSTLLDDVPATATSVSERATSLELRLALDEELARLPDKLRSAFVLCCLEGRTNSEAAGVLGCPPGTVDSRLSAARAQLRDRLVRRGFAPAVVAGVVESAVSTGGAIATEVVSSTVMLALRYAAAGGGAYPSPVVQIANGVKPMTTFTTGRMAAVLLATVLTGLTGVGVARLAAEGGREPAWPNDKFADRTAPKPPATGSKTQDAADLALEKRFNMATPPDMLTVQSLFDTITSKYSAPVRFDEPAFVKAGKKLSVKNVAEKKFRLTDAPNGLKVRDALEVFLADVTLAEPGIGPMTVVARNGVIMVVPADPKAARPEPKIEPTDRALIELGKPFKMATPLDALTVQALLSTLRDRVGLVIRFDLVEFARSGRKFDMTSVAGMKFRSPKLPANATLRQALEAMAADLSAQSKDLGPLTIKARPGEILISPANPKKK